MAKKYAEISDALTLNFVDMLLDARDGLARLGSIGSETA
jgi:hypothetical protein